jgi:hypothetical protein
MSEMASELARPFEWNKKGENRMPNYVSAYNQNVLIEKDDTFAVKQASSPLSTQFRS